MNESSVHAILKENAMTFSAFENDVSANASTTTSVGGGK